MFLALFDSAAFSFHYLCGVLRHRLTNVILLGWPSGTLFLSREEGWSLMSTPFEVLNIDKIEPGWAKYSRMRRDKFQLLKYTLQNLIKKKPRYLTPDTHTPVPSTRYQNMISPYYFKAKSLYASVLMICLKLLLSHILNYMLPIQVICIEFVYLPLCNLILI